MGLLFSGRFWLLAFIVFVLYTHPGVAAAKVHQGLGVATHAGNSLTAFVDRL